jgi:ketopantoate reductase
MAHYAFLDENNIVTEVIVGIDESELIEGLDPETWYGNFRNQICKRTSYNGKIRKNYAGIGYEYDVVLDAFIPPKCHEEAILNPTTALWNCENGEHNVELS